MGGAAVEPTVAGDGTATPQTLTWGGIDLPEGKNLVGAFHWPSETVIDTSLLSTLPEEELANGRSEIVKSGLLMGQRIWELELSEQVRRCAAFKSAVCLRDPRDDGERGARSEERVEVAR